MTPTPNDIQTAGDQRRNQPLILQGVTIHRIFAIRESGADRDLLEGLMDQTYRQFRDRPGVEEAMQLGLSPYDDPEGVDGAQAIRNQGHRAVSYVRNGTLFLIWGGSAASESDDGENPFTSYLTKLVQTFAPEELLVSTFSRLVRSQNWQAKLRKELVTAGTKVHCAGQVIDMSTSHGQMMWDIMALVYSMERDQIERRLVLGTIFAAKRGRWLAGPSATPPGYEVVKDDSGNKRLRLHRDQAEVERTRKMIAILASKGTARQKLAAITALGVTLLRNVPGGVEEYSPSQAAMQGDVVRTLDTYRHLYRTGVYMFRRVVPSMDGIDEIAGFPVESDDAGSGQYVEVPIDIGTPEGGWAAAEVFDCWEAEVARRRDGLNNRGGAHHKRVKPLTGLCEFTVGAVEYALLSDGRNAYVLRSRPVDSNRKHRGWDGRKGETTVEADLDAHTLHVSIARAIRRALQGGWDVQVSDAEVAVHDDGTAVVVFIDDATRREHHRARLTELTAKATRLADLAADSETERQATVYHERGKEVAREMDRLEALLEAPSASPAAPETMIVHGGTLMAALRVLERTETTASRKAANAIRTVIHDLRFELTEDTVRWYADVYLPTTAGLAVLRGVCGEVPRVCRTPQYRVDKIRERGEAQIMASLVAGTTCKEAVDESEAVGYRMNAVRLQQTLEARELSRPQIRLVFTHPIPEVRQVVAADVTGQPLPNDLAPAWIADVRQMIDQWPVKAVDRRLGRRKRAQLLVDALAREDRPLSIQELRREGRIPRRNLVLLALNLREGRTGVIPVEGLQPLADLAGDKLAARRCPQCDGRSWKVVCLPELWDLVCPTCCTTSGAAAPVPGSYLTWETMSPLGRYLRQDDLDLDRRIATVPDGEFTIKEWANANGMTTGAFSSIRDAMISRGLLEEVGPDPRHTGTGMIPRLYRRTDKDQTRN